MAIKKTELYSSLWQSCDELRGGMDASQYKDYVLTFLFVKYVSDKYADDPYGMIVVPENGSFEDMLKLKGDKEIGDKINKIISRLAEENDLKGVIDVADFNDEDKLGKGKDMVDRLSKLVGIFDGLDLSGNRAGGDDLLGDAYEYLMRHFATDSGKSKGQFYTPAEVSKILAKVVGVNQDTSQDSTVYDPTCGSGSLLLKVADEAPRSLSIFGQEMDNATHALARMNMILHDNPTAEISQDNTRSTPHWKNKDGSLKTFDFAVANPPFSFKSWSNGVNVTADEFGRFEYGTPPDKNGDYAFLLHIIKSLKSMGKGAVILPHGVLFRGNVEATIRKNLIKQGYIKGIIGLPANLFYGTGIPACIIVIDKENAENRQGLFMLDGSKGFMKDGNKNRLRSQDIHNTQDGWKVGKLLRHLVEEKGKKLKEVPDLIVNKKKYKSDLIPPTLIIARYFIQEQESIKQLQADKDTISQELETFIEENSGEEGLLEEAKNDKDNITKTTLKVRINQIKNNSSAKEESAALKKCLKLFDNETAANKAIKDAQTALDEKVFAQYPKLSEAEIKTLVIDNKWQGAIQSAIQTEIERVTQQLTNRVKLLEERYAEPLPLLLENVAGLSGKVDGHLKKMGLAW